MDTIKKVWICFMERNRFSKHCCENQHPYSKNIRDKNSSKHSFVHCWCNLVAVRAASFDDKKFLIFQGGQWFVDQLWERWNQWVKNGSQWTSNYNLEINGPLAPPTNFLKVTKEWIGSNTSFSWGASVRSFVSSLFLPRLEPVLCHVFFQGAGRWTI